MPLKILANTVWQDASRLVLTDVLDAEQAGTSGLEHITGGQRWQRWTSVTTADYRIVYANKNGGLSATHAVMARADQHLTHRVQILSWTNYASVNTTEYDSGVSFAPTLIGRNSQDYIWDLGSLSSKQALGFVLSAGTGGNYTKSVYSLYFADAFTLSYPGSVTRSPAPFPGRYVRKREAYAIDEYWTFRASALTKTEATTFETLYRLQDSPIFIYDADGTLIPFKLLHCVIQSFEIVAAFDDLYALTLNVAALREWT